MWSTEESGRRSSAWNVGSNGFLGFVAALAASTGLLACSGSNGSSSGGGGDKDKEIVCEGPAPSSEKAGFVRASVLRSDSGEPVKGAVVTLDGVEGCVSTGEDGMFKIPVPGGGAFKLRVRCTGTTGAMRRDIVSSGSSLSLGTIYLKDLDRAITRIGPSGGIHESSKGGLKLEFPVGSLARTVNVRATRFERSRDLPAPLPRTSHFTMAFEADVQGEALNKPVHVTLPNDYGFPPGTKVPVGAFDDKAGEWVPSGMGMVSEDGKTIEFDAKHLSSYDCNLPVTATDTPGVSRRDKKRPDKGCGRNGSGGSSEVDVRTGGLELEVEAPLGRTHGADRSLTLVYHSIAASPSAWIGGLRTENPGDLSEAPKYAGMEVQVEGVRHLVYLEAAEQENWVSFLWNGRDIDGNLKETGLYDAWLRAFYALPGVFATADVFGGPPVSSLGIEADELAEADAEVFAKLVLINQVDSPIAAGWSVAGLMSIHPHQDGTVLLVEGGESRGVFGRTGRLEIVAGDPDGGTDCGDGSPAQNRCLDYPVAVAAGPDGSVFVADSDSIRKVTPDGKWEMVYDGSSGNFDPVCLSVSPGGDLYVCDEWSGVVYKVNGSGLEKVAGGGQPYMPGLGMDPTVSHPTDVAFAPDGSMYIADWPYGLRRLAPDGTLHSLEPEGNPDYPAPYKIALGNDGSVYLAELKRCRVRRLLPDGTMITVAGRDSVCGFAGDGGFASKALLDHPNALVLAADGTLYISDQWNDRIRAIDPNGRIMTVAGKGAKSGSGFGFGGPALNGLVPRPEDLDMDGNGNLLTVYKGDGVVVRVDMQARLYGRPNGSTDSLELLSGGNYKMVSGMGAVIVFDKDGRMLERTDSHGRKTEYEYDEQGRLLRVRDDLGQVASLSYSGSGIEMIKAPDGRETRFEADPERNLVKVTFPDGTINSFSYGGNHLMSGWTDAEGRSASYEYDAYGRIKAVDRGAGRKREYKPLETQALLNDYIEAGLGKTPDDPAPPLTEPKVEVVDANGGVYTYKYDSFYEMVSVTLPDGTEIDMTNADCLMPSSVRMPDGSTTTTYYDEWGRIIKESSPLGQRSFDYDFQRGLLTSLTTWGGKIFNYTYYDDGDLKEVLDNYGKPKFTLAYTDDGQIKSITDATGVTTTYSYDGMGNLETVSSVLGTHLTFNRDARGNVVRVEDPGVTTGLDYDSMDRVVKVTDGNGDEHVISRDGQGLVTGFSSGGVATALGRDSAGRLISVSFAGAPAWSLEYDGEDRITSIGSAEGKVEVEYGLMGNIVKRSITWQGGSQTAMFDYDPAGRMLSAKDDDSSITFERDQRTKLVTSVTQFHHGMAEPITIGYNMNGDQEAEQVIYPALTGFQGGEYDFDRDEFTGRVTSTWDPDGNTYDFLRDDAGRLTGLQVNGGQDFDAEFSRDAAGRTTGVTYYKDYWREAVLLSVQDELALDGVRLRTVSAGVTIGYSYDGVRRLTGAVYSDTRQDESYSYDARGDLSGQGVSYDEYRRLISANGYEYEYDRAGRVVRRTRSSDSSKLELYWDGDDNLVQVDVYGPGDTAPAHVVKYRYDAFGRRIGRDVDGDMEFYIYDRDNLAMIVDDQGALKDFFLYGSELDRPVVMFSHGEKYGIMTDTMGTVLGLVRLSDHTVVSTWKYTALGARVEHTGQVDCPIGFQGRLHDTLTGLVYFRTREYDPAVGRFLSTDPLKFTSFGHPYAFPGMDPVNRSDPFGMGPRAVKAIGEGVLTYNGMKGKIEGGVVKAAGGEGSGTGEAARMAFKTAGNAMIDTASKAASLTPYQAYGPSVTDMIGYAYKAYKAKNPCERAKVGGEILTDIVPGGKKWLKPLVDDFNNLGNMVHAGR
ncbi:MAG: hypothetical protein GXP49_17560 [Deltaproteobacteria bacterium]|nr:hypothetical protein [Deltaproteobacteria bacterium]